MMRWAAILACALPALAQDTVTWVEVRAARTTVVAARTIELQAYAANDFGRALDGFAPRWRSLSPEVATVDGAGIVRGVAPGIAEIEAADGATGVADRMTVRVYPARVEITPYSPVLEAGQQRTLAARALDADGAAIGGVRFVWRSGLPGVVSVDEGGVLRGLAEGSATVSASVDVGTRSYQFSAQLPVRVRRRAEFSITRLVSNDQESSTVTISDLVPWGAQFSQGGENTAFLASLSNGSRALMLYRNGTLQRLVTTGDYLESLGGVVRDVSGMSVNVAGDVLARVSVTNCGPWVLFRSNGQVEPVLRECWIPNATLGDRGDIAYAGGGYPQSLTVRKADGTIQVLVKAGDPIPDSGPLININGESFTPAGHILFTVCGSNGCPAFLWNGSRVEKIPGNGDTVDGMRIEWWYGIGETANGDLFLRAGTSREQRLFRRTGGAWTSLLRSDSQGEIAFGCGNFGVTTLGDAVLFPACYNGGAHFYKWEQGRFERIAQDPGACNAALTPLGTVVHRLCNGTRLQRTTASGTNNIVVAGQALAGAAGLALFWEDIKVAGPPGSLVARSVAGGLFAIASRTTTGPAVGQTFANGAMLAHIQQIGISSAGEVVLQTNVWQPDSTSLYLWRDGQLTLLADNGGTFTTEAGDRINGFACCFQPFGFNHRRQVMAWTMWNGGQGLAVFTPGSKTARVAMRIDAPRGIPNFNAAAMDDRGRVMAVVNDGDSSGVYLSDNGVVTKTLSFGTTDASGRRVNGVGQLAAAGERFYAVANFDNGQSLIEFAGGSWRPLNVSFTGLLSANVSGDILVTGRYFNTPTVLLRKADGTERMVASASEPTADGEWFLDLYSAFLTDAGDIYFTGRTAAGTKDRVALYRAIPR